MKRTLMMLITLAPICTWAADAKFPHELEERIAAMGDAAASAPEGAADAPEGNEAWTLQNFWLRMRPRGGFDMPGIGEALLIPELELLWQRDLPEGWELYTPPTEAPRAGNDKRT